MGSHQPFLININYHKIPLIIFLGGPTHCQNMWFKICGRSRSDLKMSNNKHLLPQWPFLININYHKICLRIFLGDIRIPPDPSPCPLLTQTPTPAHCPFTPVPSFCPSPCPHPLALGHLVALGPPTPPNLNILMIWFRNPWVSIQINFWASLLPKKKCHIHVK